jgi:hypothetical protein
MIYFVKVVADDLRHRPTARAGTRVDSNASKLCPFTDVVFLAVERGGGGQLMATVVCLDQF